MTLRRLAVLIRALPEDALWRRELAAAIEAAEKVPPTQQHIRDRKAAFEARNAAQRAKEAGA